MARKTTQKADQKWPFVTWAEREQKWRVDSRTKSGGDRRFFSTKAEAEEHANKCRVQRENLGLDAYAAERLAAHGKTVQDAIAFYADWLDRQSQSREIAGVIEELICSRRGAGRSDRYCHDLQLRLGRFAKEHPKRSVATFTAKELDAWLLGLSLSPGTRNTFRRDLRTLFSFAEKRGYTATDEARKTERAKTIDRAPDIVSVAVMKVLLAGAGADTLPFFAISAFAGVRAAELARLDWSEIDLEAGFIEITAAKSKGQKKRRLIRISDNLRAWLALVVRKSGPVVPVGARKRLDAVKRLAGFGRLGSETDNERKRGVVLQQWPQNALRHSFASYHLAHHQDAPALALEMGNSPAMIFAHYRELVRPAEAAKWWQILPQ